MKVSTELQQFITRFQLQLPTVSDALGTHTRQAAILIPIINRPCPTLLLTQRALHLRQHAGQVAFPGGATDQSDSTLIETALRETQEEVALHPQHVRILGQLPAEKSSSGFHVTPFVGLLDANINPTPCKNEVAALFEMPLNEALTLSRYYPLDVQQHGNLHRLYFLSYQHFLVWGLTARIIRKLAQQIASPL